MLIRGLLVISYLFGPDNAGNYSSMWWEYLFVLLGTIAVDITPLPLPPAFTVMVLFQIMFGLSIWPVIVIGVIGSIIGRYILTLYIAIHSFICCRWYSPDETDIYYPGFFCRKIYQ